MFMPNQKLQFNLQSELYHNLLKTIGTEVSLGNWIRIVCTHFENLIRKVITINVKLNTLNILYASFHLV